METQERGAVISAEGEGIIWEESSSTERVMDYKFWQAMADCGGFGPHFETTIGHGSDMLGKFLSIMDRGWQSCSTPINTNEEADNCLEPTIEDIDYKKLHY